MGLSKCKLGKYIELREITNADYSFDIESVRGVNNLKRLMPTKADLNGRDLSKFQIVYPDEFVFNHRTSRNGSKFSIAYNDSNKPVICTEDYVVFRIREEARTELSPEWLYMFFNRAEFDRYVIINSWGSSTEFYNWEDLCEVEVELPLLCVQQKYVDIYNAMVANQQAYERGLEDLKLTCDGYIEELRRKMPCEKIGPYLRPCNERNSNNAISLFQGVNVEHIFTAPKRVAEDCENGSIVRTGQFAFNRVMKSHNTKLPIALRDGPDCVVSSSYQVFEIVNVEVLMPQYLMLWMNRKETQRFAGYVSYGTTRDIFSFENMCDVQIPIPGIEVQKSIAEMYTVYNARKKINEQLKAQIKNICPILIRGSLEE